MLSHGLRLVPMNGASDTYLLLVVKSPDIVHVSVSDGDLPLGFDEWVHFGERVLVLLRLALLLSEDIVLGDQRLTHNLANTVHGVVIHRLILVRGLIHCQVVQNVFLITLVDEKLVLIFLDDDIPRVEGFGSGHDG